MFLFVFAHCTLGRCVLFMPFIITESDVCMFYIILFSLIDFFYKELCVLSVFLLIGSSFAD